MTYARSSRAGTSPRTEWAAAALTAVALLIAATEPWFDAHTYYSGEIFVVSGIVAVVAIVVGTLSWRRARSTVAVASTVVSAALLFSYFVLLVVFLLAAWANGGS